MVAPARGISLASMLRGSVAVAAAGTLVLRVVQAVFGLLISLALAHLLGAAGYGAYTFALTCVGVLSIPALLGFDTLLVRQVARYKMQGEWPFVVGLLRRARQIPLMSAFAVGAVAASLAWGGSSYMKSNTLSALWIALLALPILTIMRVKQAVTIGLGRVVTGLTPETVIQPIVFILLLAVAPILWPKALSAPVLVAAYVISATAALIAATVVFRWVQPSTLLRTSPAYETNRWLKSSMSFCAVTCLNILGTSLGILMLGPMHGEKATGVFGIANAAASLVALPLSAMNVPLGPAFAGAYTKGDKGDQTRLRQLARKAARGTLALALPAGLVLILFGRELLPIFGPDFTAGYPALVILCLAQLFNVGMGSVGLLLQMTGHERLVLLGIAIALVINASLNIILIPTWGPTGAALGAAGYLVTWNVLLSVWVWRRLGVRSMAIG
jgi:O-antigen/teichoic acid export membrane protein